MNTMPGEIVLKFTETGELSSISFVCSDLNQERQLRAALDRLLKDAPKEEAA